MHLISNYVVSFFLKKSSFSASSSHFFEGCVSVTGMIRYIVVGGDWNMVFMTFHILGIVTSSKLT